MSVIIPDASSLRFVLELTSPVTRIFSSRDAAVMVGSEYVAGRNSVSLETLFQETRILLPELSFVLKYRLLDIHSNVTWAELLLAVAEAESISQKVLLGLVRRHLIMKGLLPETWRVSESQKLSVFVYQLTVDALALIFPDGLLVNVELQPPISIFATSAADTHGQVHRMH